jgi:hypothetical protein
VASESKKRKLTHSRQKKKTPPTEADEVPTMKNELLVGI